MHRFITMVVCAAALLSACGGDDDGGGDDGGGPGTPVVPGADTSFGDGGMATVGFPGGLAGIMRVARQPDGKVVGCGGTQESLLLVRVGTDGTLDTSFGGTGIVQLPWGVATNGVTVGYGCAVQADGKIVSAARVLGSYDGLAAVEVVVRLLPDGTLDPDFADGGVFVGEHGTIATSLAIDADGNLVVGGSGRLERFLPDGTRDAAFGEAGIAAASVSALDLAIQDDGMILAAGGGTVARFTAAGAPDDGFGTAGVLTLPSSTQAYSLALAADGRPLVGGTTAGATQQEFWIGRFTTDGMPDTTFAGTGSVQSDAGGTAYGIATSPDGTIVGSGYYTQAGGAGRTVRFTGQGTLDASFGSGGIGPGDNYDIPFSNVALDPGGSFTIAGAGIDQASFGFDVFFSHITADGQPDPAFGAGAGTMTFPVGGSFDRAHAIAFQPDGKLVVGGWSYTGGGVGLARLGDDGALDTTFGPDGTGTVARSDNLLYVNAISVQPTGRILVSGVSGFGGDARVFAVERYDAAGALDPSFGTSGVAGGAVVAGKDALGVNMTTAPDGTIVVVGQTQTATDGVAEFGVMELTPDGAPKAGFGTGGAAATAFGSGLALATHAAVQSDGSVVVLGITAGGATLVRFTPAGGLDADFGTVTLPGSGMVSMGLAALPDDSIIAVAGNYITGDMEVVHLDAGGQLDAGFGDGGVAAHSFRPNDYYGQYAFFGVTPLPDGKILLGLAAASQDGLTESGLLLRLDADGSDDATYGDGGVQTVAIGRGSTSLHAVALDPQGRLVVAGRTWTDAGASDFMVIRFAADP